MLLENYKQFLVGTIKLYSDRIKNYIGKMLMEKGIACNGSQQVGMFETFSAVNVGELEIEEQIIRCLSESPEAIRLFEEWEYDKDYRYSSIFTVGCFDQLKKAVLSVPENKDIEDESEYTVANNSIVLLPLRREIDGQSMIKFCFAFSAVHPQSGEELLLKYPVLVVLHKEYELVEIRFGTLKQYFGARQDFYQELIQRITGYFSQNLGIELEPLDMLFMKEATTERVKLVAEHMNMASGGRAVLEVGDNEECVLPFIGELKGLLQEYSVELEKVPAVRDALSEFIFEKSEMSEYPWIELLWVDEIKTRQTRTKFTFNYANSGFGLIQHYHNPVLIGRGAYGQCH